MTFVGTRERPYRRVPPQFSEDGIPWGAWCACVRCGFVARSTGTFDYYNREDGLTCGGCLGFDHKAAAAVGDACCEEDPTVCDSLGPGCRGGYAEELGDAP